MSCTGQDGTRSRSQSRFSIGRYRRRLTCKKTSNLASLQQIPNSSPHLLLLQTSSSFKLDRGETSLTSTTQPPHTTPDLFSFPAAREDKAPTSTQHNAAIDLQRLLSVRLSVCLQHQHCNAALEVRRAVTALSIITACIIDRSIMAAARDKNGPCWNDEAQSEPAPHTVASQDTWRQTSKRVHARDVHARMCVCVCARLSACKHVYI